MRRAIIFFIILLFTACADNTNKGTGVYRQVFNDFDLSDGTYTLYILNYLDNVNPQTKNNNYYISDARMLDLIERYWILEEKEGHHRCGFDYTLKLEHNDSILITADINTTCKDLMIGSRSYFFDANKLLFNHKAVFGIVFNYYILFSNQKERSDFINKIDTSKVVLNKPFHYQAAIKYDSVRSFFISEKFPSAEAKRKIVHPFILVDSFENVVRNKNSDFDFKIGYIGSNRDFGSDSAKIFYCIYYNERNEFFINNQADTLPPLIFYSLQDINIDGYNLAPVR